MYLISGVVVQGWQYMYGCAIPLFYMCYSRHRLLHSCQTTTWPFTTPRTWSAVTLGFREKSLNNVPHQRCSCPRMMIHVWLCYPTVLWELYEVWITSDRGESPHRPQHDIQLHSGHAQLLLWFFGEKGLNNVPHQWGSDSRMMIHVWIYYPTVLCVFYGACITYDRVNHLTNKSMTSNYTKDMLSCYTEFWKQRAWTMYLISGVVVQECWYMYGYAIPLFYECYMRHGPHMTGVNHPIDHIITLITPKTCSAVTLMGSKNKEPG